MVRRAATAYLQALALIDAIGKIGRDGLLRHGPFIHLDVRGTPARWGRWPP